MIDIAVPTKQRLRKAASGPGEPANDNFTVVGGTYRMQDQPAKRLHINGTLTDTQYQAAERYLADFYAAGLSPLGAFDYTRPVVDGKSAMTDSDYRLAAVDRWNKARGLLGSFFAAAVDPIVCDEVSVEIVGRRLGHGNAPQARAVAVDRLKGGLNILTRHYGLVG